MMETSKGELTNDVAILEQICDYINREFFQTPVNFKIITGYHYAPHKNRENIIIEPNNMSYTAFLGMPYLQLGQSYVDLIKELLHQMIVIYGTVRVPDWQKKIKNKKDYHSCEFPTSSNGYYLNRTYKEIAEAIGCTVKKDKKYGLKLDRIPQKLIKYCEQFDWSIYNFYVSENLLNKKQTSSNSRKYICPRCGGIARTTSDFPLMCKRCGVDLIYTTK